MTSDLPRSWHDKERIIERLAEDLVICHNDTGIDLADWESARMLVELYYKLDIEREVQVLRRLTDEEKERGY